jgi:D-alanine--poly(phosphoribitol) ligase subunit 2
MRQQLIDLIQNCIIDICGQQDLKVPTDSLGEHTLLFGEKGMFDSVGLVSLVVSLEEAIEDRLGAAVSLADQKAMSQKSSPFRTVGTLADYAHRLVQGSA